MSAGRPERVKATDVAARANVSIATVSLVANGKAEGRVSLATRQRVEQVIVELGYVVNPAARSLVTGRHGRIALLAHDLTNPFIAAIAVGVGDALGSDVQLILAAGGSERKPPDAALISSFGVDGMVVNLDGSEFDLGSFDHPVVVIDEPEPRSGASRVFFDLQPGAAALAEHLVELGHRQLVYVDSARPRSTFTARRKGLQDNLRRASTSVKMIRVKCELELESAQALAVRSLESWLESGVTAVVTATDVQAYGVLAAAVELGIAVPGDFSVASFDNNAMSKVTNPPLTSVDLSARSLGHEAATLLQREIEGSTQAGREVRLPTRLVVRASTARAR